MKPGLYPSLDESWGSGQTLNRAAHDATSSVALTANEMHLLDHPVPDKEALPEDKSISSPRNIKIALLGAYFAGTPLQAT